MNTAAIKKQFDELYAAEADGIFRFCLVRVSDRELALDLTQETFTRLWSSLLEGQTISNARAFLFTVAYRLIIDWYRKKKSLSFEALSDSETDEAFDPADERAFEQLESGAEGRFLLRKLEELGPSYRLAVYLRFVEGLSPPDIGKILGVSANAASVRVTRGLEELRKISGYSDDGED